MRTMQGTPTHSTKWSSQQEPLHDIFLDSLVQRRGPSIPQECLPHRWLHPSGRRNFVRVMSRARKHQPHVGIFVKFVRSDIIHREDELHIVLSSFFDESVNVLRTSDIKQRVPNLRYTTISLSKKLRHITHRNILECLFESKRHATANDE
jgi:hypothetical protein